MIRLAKRYLEASIFRCNWLPAYTVEWTAYRVPSLYYNFLYYFNALFPGVRFLNALSCSFVYCCPLCSSMTLYYEYKCFILCYRFSRDHRLHQSLDNIIVLFSFSVVLTEDKPSYIFKNSLRFGQFRFMVFATALVMY